jgi:hypothetical protein
MKGRNLGNSDLLKSKNRLGCITVTGTYEPAGELEDFHHSDSPDFKARGLCGRINV